MIGGANTNSLVVNNEKICVSIFPKDLFNIPHLGTSTRIYRRTKVNFLKIFSRPDIDYTITYGAGLATEQTSLQRQTGQNSFWVNFIYCKL